MKARAMSIAFAALMASAFTVSAAFAGCGDCAAHSSDAKAISAKAGGCGGGVCPVTGAKDALGGGGEKEGKAASSCPALVSGAKCAQGETKAAQGGDGTKTAKSSCPACAASATKCAKCEKAALGGGGEKDVHADAHAAESGCPVCASGRACAVCATKKAAKAAKVSGEAKPAYYGNLTCPIMGGKADPKQFVAYHDEKTHTYANIYMCCPGCTDKVKKDPAAAYLKAYLGKEVKGKDGKVIAKKGQPVALHNTACPISGGKVAKGQQLTYNGYTVGLCCPGCEKAFMKSPDKNLAKVIKATNAPKAEKATQ